MPKKSSFSEFGCFPLPLLDKQADLVESKGLNTLLYCPNAWALRHHFIHQEAGETIRARCNCWDCLYCGRRKVDQWRQLVNEGEPTLFLTLSKVGKTVEEAARRIRYSHNFFPESVTDLRRDCSPILSSKH